MVGRIVGPAIQTSFSCFPFTENGIRLTANLKAMVMGQKYLGSCQSRAGSTSPSPPSKKPFPPSSRFIYSFAPGLVLRTRKEQLEGSLFWKTHSVSSPDIRYTSENDPPQIHRSSQTTFKKIPQISGTCTSSSVNSGSGIVKPSLPFSQYVVCSPLPCGRSRGEPRITEEWEGSEMTTRILLVC